MLVGLRKEKKWINDLLLNVGKLEMKGLVG